MNKKYTQLFISFCFFTAFSVCVGQTRMLKVAKGNPINIDGTWNFEVLLTNPAVILDHTLAKSDAKLIFDLVDHHQTKRRKLVAQIPPELPIAKLEFEKWMIDQELQTQLSNQVDRTLSAELIQRLKKQSIENFLKDRFISEIILQADVSQQLNLSKVQRTKIKKLDIEIREEFLEFAKRRWIRQFKELIATLNDNQRTKIKPLVGDFSRLKSMDSERWISCYRSLKRNIEWSSLKYKPIILSYLGYLNNKKIVAKLELTTKQVSEIRDLSRDYFVETHKLIEDRDHDRLEATQKEFEDNVSRVLLRHQLQILQREICQQQLPWMTPLKFLDLSIVKNELGIDSTQREKLANDFSKIQKRNITALEKTKQRLETRVVNALSTSQRRKLDEIVSR